MCREEPSSCGVVLVLLPVLCVPLQPLGSGSCMHGCVKLGVLMLAPTCCCTYPAHNPARFGVRGVVLGQQLSMQSTPQFSHTGASCHQARGPGAGLVCLRLLCACGTVLTAVEPGWPPACSRWGLVPRCCMNANVHQSCMRMTG